MPYVDPNKRLELDEIVDLMKKKGIQADGDLNYILYKYCKDNMISSYNNLKNYLGELNECANEIRRRILSPYEDGKIKQNGDIGHVVYKDISLKGGKIDTVEKDTNVDIIEHVKNTSGIMYDFSKKYIKNIIKEVKDTFKEGK